MKKIFTLFTAALAAMSVNAQDWNATNSGPLAKGATILDNEYVTVVTAVQDSETALILVLTSVDSCYGSVLLDKLLKSHAGAGMRVVVDSRAYDS